MKIATGYGKTLPADLVSRYLRGELTVAAVARLASTSATSALRQLRAAGIDTSLGTRKRLVFARRRGHPGLHLEAAARYRQGETLAAVADRFGLTKDGVRQILLRDGVPLRARGGRRR